MTAARTDRVAQDDRQSRLLALAVDRLMRDVPALRPLRRLLEKLTRYAGVGIASSLIYAVAVAVATTGLRVTPVLSALLAYGITIPINFLMHRHFTFRSVDGVQRDLRRYAFAQAIGMTMSYVSMALSVDVLHLPYGVGIAGAVVVVPVVSYLLMDRWVFALSADR